MFTPQIDQIFNIQTLKDSFLEISSKSTGLDEVSYNEFKKDLSKNFEDTKLSILKGTYTPEPLKKIEIDKPNSDEKRPIALSSIKDKLIQKVLYNSLRDYFETTFSDKSYAYRRDKSTIKAINRSTQFIQEKKYWVLKTDIDNFFESINHDKLLMILDKQISDKRIIKLISLFLQTGAFKSFDYFEHIEGVHQGDILSPLLSNIYLDLMDKFLERENISFVRYADDFIVLFENEKDAVTFKPILEEFLQTLDLKLEDEKTKITHVKDGFIFLGVNFVGKNRFVDNERLQKSISKMHNISKTKLGFKGFIDEINSYLSAIKNYYLKIIQPNSTQHLLLKEHLIETISHKVFLTKSAKIIKTKKEFKILLSQINFDILFDTAEINDKYELIISKAYEKYLANKSYKESKTKIDKKKNEYAKKFANDSTLHISKAGLSLGISKNKFVVKEYGKVQKSIPFDKVSRIILEGKGISLSTDIIKKSAQNNITIDFIDQDAICYASLLTNKASTTQTIHKQALVLKTSLQLELAICFIKGKAKNQINYLKYLDKYHNLLDENITKMETILQLNVKKSQNTEQLLGYEGSISALYWEGLRIILEVPFEKRVTFGAKDIVNSSLNYGYAILYGKIQHSLVHAGLSLNISFLHALDEQKPTLVFDMIEEFRTFVVDRTIISMINKNEPISLGNDGLLTKPSRQLIAKNIKEKLGSYTMWKKESIKVENIIQTQCFKLSKVIEDNTQTYKPFIGKF
ncbi:CRISPR-associated endonuclease Cas1 [Aliarcobacter cryaerophilus]|uniref:CRISPR-associated endonuclease Cas1 n=1 Tax=Aliarcobacter cryaerophilus TaxID=28198 RepID=UPI0021B6E5FF|nr:CRISPR-associated endonuclease Cas1 [Aliarcobacter cryaerophilus]MCT7482476.1 CRISPR-associated endonuclease Cas1 [Aliarcobacter cryaerophilus]